MEGRPHHSNSHGTACLETGGQQLLEMRRDDLIEVTDDVNHPVTWRFAPGTFVSVDYKADEWGYN